MSYFEEPKRKLPSPLCSAPQLRAHTQLLLRTAAAAGRRVRLAAAVLRPQHPQLPGPTSRLLHPAASGDFSRVLPAAFRGGACALEPLALFELGLICRASSDWYHEQHW